MSECCGQEPIQVFFRKAVPPAILLLLVAIIIIAHNRGCDDAIQTKHSKLAQEGLEDFRNNPKDAALHKPEQETKPTTPSPRRPHTCAEHTWGHGDMQRPRTGRHSTRPHTTKGCHSNTCWAACIARQRVITQSTRGGTRDTGRVWEQREPSV